jgi:6-phosphogluconate dehydrogenase
LSFFDGYRSDVLPANMIQAQRDYFGAHTFKVLPGQENERLVADHDIRKLVHCLRVQTRLIMPTDINWTGRGGNVSASSYVV